MNAFSLAVVTAVLAGGLMTVRGGEEEAGVSVTVGVDLSSAYVFRGATLNDGAVVQPSLAISGWPIAFGVWANLDLEDYDGALDKGEFSEVDLTASYRLPFDAVEATLAYTEYLYMSGADADREVSATLGLSRIPLSPTLMLAYGVDGAIRKTLYVEAGLSQEFVVKGDLTVDLSGAVGYIRPDEGDAGFAPCSVTAGVRFKMIRVSVTYIGRLDDTILVDVEDGGLYDVDVYGTVGVSFAF